MIQMGIFGNELKLMAKVDKDYQNTKENSLILDKENILEDENKIQNINNIASEEWKIRIPKINLEAPINEGTTSQVLNEFVGHFEETQKQIGNIGLAAHNRGYKVNYFERLKLLEIGDEVYYSYKNIENRYVINSKNIIKDTDWSWLENTKDNRITLITCVENRPKYRLCIQAIENKK